MYSAEVNFVPLISVTLASEEEVRERSGLRVWGVGGVGGGED